jgi:hypothetical protein
MAILRVVRVAEGPSGWSVVVQQDPAVEIPHRDGQPGPLSRPSATSRLAHNTRALRTINRRSLFVGRHGYPHRSGLDPTDRGVPLKAPYSVPVSHWPTRDPESNLVFPVGLFLLAWQDLKSGCRILEEIAGWIGNLVFDTYRR